MRFISEEYTIEEMLEDFEEDRSILDGVDLMVVASSRDCYEEEVVCIYRKDNGKYYAFEAYHCSCYGFEGLWDEVETTLKTIKHWSKKGEYELRECAETFLENLKKEEKENV